MPSPLTIARDNSLNNIFAFISNNPADQRLLTPENLLQALADRRFFQLEVNGYFINFIDQPVKIDAGDLQDWLQNYVDEGKSKTKLHGISTSHATTLLNKMAEFGFGEINDGVLTFNETTALKIVELCGKKKSAEVAPLPLSKQRTSTTSGMQAHMDSLDERRQAAAAAQLEGQGPQ